MIDKLVATMRQVALCRPLLIAVDGLPHYRKTILDDAVSLSLATVCQRSTTPDCLVGYPDWSCHQTQAERCIDRRTPPTGEQAANLLPH
ncbi:MAG: hypothetical protein M9965_15615 [Anaerolineae bacterium]|nr:hypothetical protein [Anaerolineae bacterium]